MVESLQTGESELAVAPIAELTGTLLVIVHVHPFESVAVIVTGNVFGYVYVLEYVCVGF
jgi:hypothetical protein